MSRLALLTLSLALLAQGAAAARYNCGYYNGVYRCRRHHSLVGGAIAGIAIGSILLFLLVFCTIMACCLRRRRSMRFRSPGAGKTSPGRQVGFMYFPTMEERKNGMYQPHNGDNVGAHSQGPIDHTRAGPAAVTPPPPAYAGNGQSYQPPAGGPPSSGNPYVTNSGAYGGNSYAPPSGPPPTRN